jgi:hypothetical protein
MLVETFTGFPWLVCHAMRCKHQTKHPMWQSLEKGRCHCCEILWKRSFYNIKTAVSLCFYPRNLPIITVLLNRLTNLGIHVMPQVVALPSRSVVWQCTLITQLLCGNRCIYGAYIHVTTVCFCCCPRILPMITVLPNHPTGLGIHIVPQVVALPNRPMVSAVHFNYATLVWQQECS